jgi:hypothetical protein
MCVAISTCLAPSALSMPRSLVITSNLVFTMTTAAAIDRLVHHDRQK